jgi:hypothetical protein
MYALQIVQEDVCGTTRRTLIFEYPLDNTWTYKAAIEPLGKNHRMSAIFGPINSTLPPSCYSHFPYAPRLPKCSQSVFEAFVSVL